MCIRDFLDFAPRSVTHIPHMTPIESHQHRLDTVVPHEAFDNVYWSHGLLPASSFSCNSFTRVVCASPFSGSGRCLRALTSTESARCFDLPVAIGRRLEQSYPHGIPLSHDLYKSIPLKLLCHSLWLSGLCDFSSQSNGGTNFSSNSKKILFVSQSEFNKTFEHIDVEAVKMDDAEVPVSL